MNRLAQQLHQYGTWSYNGRISQPMLAVPKTPKFPTTNRLEPVSPHRVHRGHQGFRARLSWLPHLDPIERVFHM